MRWLEKYRTNIFNKTVNENCIKDRVHCFSMQVVMNKYFLLNPEKILAQIRHVVFEINAPLILKNDVTEPKARRLGYSNYS